MANDEALLQCGGTHNGNGTGGTIGRQQLCCGVHSCSAVDEHRIDLRVTRHSLDTKVHHAVVVHVCDAHHRVRGVRMAGSIIACVQREQLGCSRGVCAQGQEGAVGAPLVHGGCEEEADGVCG